MLFQYGLFSSGNIIMMGIPKLVKFKAFIFCCVFLSCAYPKIEDTTTKFYTSEQLRHDYSILQSILEKKHPSIYWYTEKDSMKYYFNHYKQSIKDSMNEQQFTWQILNPLVNKIHCGHTEVIPSKSFEKKEKKHVGKQFPLNIKVWNDTAVVINSMFQNDSIFKQGTIINSINGLSIKQIIQQMRGYFSEDGFAGNATLLKISFNFPYYYKNIFDLKEENEIEYTDSLGNVKKAIVVSNSPLKKLNKDNLKTIPQKHISKLIQYRNFEIDSSGKFAVMRLNTFSKGKLRRFFRQSFRECKKKHIANLILDIRLNGGGKVSNSTLLTKYLSNRPFKIADSVYATSKSLYPFNKYFKSPFINNVGLTFITNKNKDGKYHLTSFEKNWHKPKKRLHYNGKVYLITSGLTFSASCLLANVLKGQSNINLAGEETGGGWYGNSGILIPKVILPATGIRINMPLFRIVQYKHPGLKGTGIRPDIQINTSYDALKKGYDKKLTVIKTMIINDSDSTMSKK